MMALNILSCMRIIVLVLFLTWNVSSLAIHKYLDGDVTVVGLFDLSQGANCDETNSDAEKTLDAIKWYLKRLSSSGDLPFRLGKSYCIEVFCLSCIVQHCICLCLFYAKIITLKK